MLQAHQCTSCFMHDLCRTAVVAPLSPIVPQPPQPWHSLRCPSLEALVAELVLSQVDFCHALVDMQGIGEGLHRVGTTHMAKWTADSWAFHCSCCVMHCQLAVRHVWHKHTQGTCQDCHSCPLMSDPHVTIQPLPIKHICTVICIYLDSAVYPEVTHSNTFSTWRHSAISFPIRKVDEVRG